jgi:hypothetical protein
MALLLRLAAAVFFVRARRTEFPLQRQQLKWLTRGTLLAVAPFTVLYVIPYLADIAVPALFQNVAGLSLVFLPLTFSWAIVRYRLMDVDLIFKRGVTYTLATAALVGLYFGVVAVTAETRPHPPPQPSASGDCSPPSSSPALIFDPSSAPSRPASTASSTAKRFDYRETLIDFGRGLNSQTDLTRFVDSIVERLPRPSSSPASPSSSRKAPAGSFPQPAPPRRLARPCLEPPRLPRTPGRPPRPRLPRLRRSRTLAPHLFLENPAAGSLPQPESSKTPQPHPRPQLLPSLPRRQPQGRDFR